MKTKLIYPIVVVVFAAACGGDGEDGKRVAGQQYETVQEGSAAGVTSSIAGPGETLPPITDTNADTTSAFTLNPNAVSGSTPPAAVAGTMAGSTPVYTGSTGGMSSGGSATGGMSPAYNPPPQRSASQAAAPSSPAPQRQAYTPPPMTSSSSRPAPQPPPADREPAPPQNAEPVEGPAADADTAAPNTAPPPSTNTAPPPSAPPQAEPQESEEPADDEQAEEPPPPPATI